MKSKTLAILLMFVLAFSLGCIGSGGEKTTTSSAGTLQNTTTSGSEKTATSSKPETLVVYSYDSFEYIARAAFPKFEEKYGVKVKLITVGDAGQLLNRLILEKDNPQADVVIGIDNSLAAKAIKAGILDPYKPENIDLVPEWLIEKLDPTYHLIPYDYGYIAINYRLDRVSEPPKSFEDLTRPEWKGKLVIEDPRTSSPGAAFLLWTIAVYGDDGYLDYWEKLRENGVVITEGWSDAWYGKFMQEGYPLVLSYSTSPAATVYYENNTNVRAVAFGEGNYLQVEGAGIVKGTKKKALAQKFIEWLLTEDFQGEVPTNQWMYPVNPAIKLPDVYRYAVPLEEIRPVSLDPEYVRENFDRWIREWVQLMVQGKSPEEIKASREG
ncbi:thiamine ABC transporter substrate-binding protein [Thermococcus waiotapuensis]|uniref:Thiamine ABC transporter substrate-binding protein n=1 Tax=Thermococcus waiotapuensis TaxID=90909 RepID=A0AAE4T326_9EURY|nr:thiamine ABC transporter substrate-binding protein [Thermococcus waiotapuensis]MDV3103403.1 thiamine ABC transporter substrate-binding protein [Thermococcus waiotapuensis]